MSDLLDSVEAQWSLGLMQRLAISLGQSHTATGRAMAGLIPKVMMALSIQSSDSQAMGALYNVLKEGASNPALGDLNALVDSKKLGADDAGNPARELIGLLFGQNTGHLQALIQKFSGVKPHNTTPLLGLAGAMVMRDLGRKAADGMTQGNLASQLGKERSRIAGAVPYDIVRLMEPAQAAA